VTAGAGIRGTPAGESNVSELWRPRPPQAHVQPPRPAPARAACFSPREGDQPVTVPPSGTGDRGRAEDELTRKIT